MTTTDTPREPSPASRNRSVPTGPARPLLGAISAEWVKFRSVRSSWLGMGTALLLMMVIAPGAALSNASNMDNGHIPVADVPASEMALYATVWVVQFVVMGLALTSATNEYSSGSVRPSLQAVPRRWRFLTAKAVVLSAVVFTAGLLMSLLGTFLSHLVLQHPLVEGHGTLVASEVVADTLRSAALLALSALFGLGAGTALRSAASGLVTVFMLFLGLPLMLMMLGGDAVLEVFSRLPFPAGIAFLDSGFLLGPLDSMLSPTGGLVVLMVWAAAALAAGALVLNRRDA